MINLVGYEKMDAKPVLGCSRFPSWTKRQVMSMTQAVNHPRDEAQALWELAVL